MYNFKLWINEVRTYLYSARIIILEVFIRISSTYSTNCVYVEIYKTHHYDIIVSDIKNSRRQQVVIILLINVLMHVQCFFFFFFVLIGPPKVWCSDRSKHRGENKNRFANQPVFCRSGTYQLNT